MNFLRTLTLAPATATATSRAPRPARWMYKDVEVDTKGARRYRQRRYREQPSTQEYFISESSEASISRQAAWAPQKRGAEPASPSGTGGLKSVCAPPARQFRGRLHSERSAFMTAAPFILVLTTSRGFVSTAVAMPDATPRPMRSFQLATAEPESAQRSYCRIMASNIVSFATAKGTSLAMFACHPVKSPRSCMAPAGDG